MTENILKTTKLNELQTRALVVREKAKQLKIEAAQIQAEFEELNQLEQYGYYKVAHGNRRKIRMF